MHRQRHFLASIIFLWLTVSCNAVQHDAPGDQRYAEDRNGITYNVFEHSRTATKLSFVTNSGICETTPGVNQYSGYLTVNDTLNMFFWFFEARNAPATSPVVMWLNGGPGCSSMMGLFVENGPCYFPGGATEPYTNAFSWNTVANMLYVDQPGETGFRPQTDQASPSYGANDIASTANASTIIWIFMQVFYDAFPQYVNRNFSLFTESYGGHFGPEFALNFHTKNLLIDDGQLPGSRRINLVSLAINNPWLDPVTQYRSYLTFALNNTYRPLINETLFFPALLKYYQHCYPAIKNCTSTGTGDAANCSMAADECYVSTAWQVEELHDGHDGVYDKGFSQYDIRQPADSAFPPDDAFERYLNRDEVKLAVGVPVEMGFVACLDQVNNRFGEGGDQARSFLGELGKVVDAGITVLLWAGDADWICNWMGVLDFAHAIDFPNRELFVNTPVVPLTVNGQVYGEYKTVDNLSWLRVYNSGHFVPYYQPLMSLEVFVQTIYGAPIHAT
ncbi:Alpha/Beta hydrolase protein [Cladorrhinum sp. PSN332]|nr:Alpha/Beta hydrolase protein [Cladorrhinum sp. PSN332]